MKSLFELYAFAEELIELAIISGDEEVADLIEESVDSAMNQDVVEYQLAELLHAFIVGRQHLRNAFVLVHGQQ